MATKVYHVLQRFTKETLGSDICWECCELIERSALARCNVLTHHTKQEHSSDYVFSDLCATSFLLFLLPFCFSMTTQWEGPRHKDKDHHDYVDNTTPHPTTQPTTTRDTRHGHGTTQQKKNKDTHVHAHVHVSVCVFVHVVCSCACRCHFCSFLTKKTQSGTRTFHDVYCSKPLDLPQWLNIPFLIQVQTWQTTQPENWKSKKKIRPSQKLQPFNCLKNNSTGARNRNCIS